MLMCHYYYYYFSGYVNFKCANSTYCLPHKHFDILIVVLKCKRTKIVYWHIIKKKLKKYKGIVENINHLYYHFRYKPLDFCPELF